MKSIKTKLLSIALLFALFSCEKVSDAISGDKLEGTWKVQSVIIKDSDGAETNFWALYLAFFPCVDNITYTFKDGTYSSNVPSGCVDDDGETLSLLSASGGTYSVTDGQVTLDVDGQALGGNITFSGNQAIVTTVDPDDLSSTLTITFVKS